MQKCPRTTVFNLVGSHRDCTSSTTDWSLKVVAATFNNLREHSRGMIKVSWGRRELEWRWLWRLSMNFDDIGLNSVGATCESSTVRSWRVGRWTRIWMSLVSVTQKPWIENDVNWKDAWWRNTMKGSKLSHTSWTLLQSLDFSRRRVFNEGSLRRSNNEWLDS